MARFFRSFPKQRLIRSIPPTFTAPASYSLLTSVTQNQSASLVNIISRQISIAQGAIANLIKVAGKPIVSQAVSAVMLVRVGVHNQLVSITASIVTSFNRQFAKNQYAAVAQAQIVTLPTRAIAKLVSISQSLAVNLIKKVGHGVIAVTQSAMAILIRGNKKIIAFAQGTSAVFLPFRTNKVIGVTQASVLTLRRAMSKTVVVVQAGISTLIRYFAKNITFAITQTLLVKSSNGLNKVFVISQASFVTFSRYSFGKAIIVNLASTIGLSRNIGHIIRVAQAVATGLARLAIRFRIRALGNEPVYLLEIQVYNPNTLAVETKYFSTKTLSTRPDDTPAEVVYDGRMNSAGELDRKMFDNGGTIGEPSINSGYFELNNGDGGLSYLLNYGIDGRTFVLKLLNDKSNYVNTATTVFTGSLRGLASADLRKSLQLRIRDKLEELKRPLLSDLYGGTTISSGPTADGDASLLNVIKPRAFGDVLFHAPKCVNPFDLIYQCSGRALSLINVYDGGVQLTRDTDYASLALLQAATIPAGKWSSCLSAGLFRLASAPAHQVTAQCMAGAVTWAANQDLYEPGPVAKQILIAAGVSTSDMDQPSFDNLMTTSGAGSYRCGIYVTDQSTVLSLASKILASVGAAIVSTADNKYRAVVLAPLPLPVSGATPPSVPSGSPVDTFTVNDIASGDASFVLQASPQAEGDGVPTWWINLKWGFYYITQSQGDLAGAVAQTQVYDYSQQWRTIPWFDSSVQTVHPLAQTLDFETQLTRIPNIEAKRRLVAYQSRRDFVSVTFPDTVVDRNQVIEIGAVVALTIPHLGYSSKLFYVVGRKIVFGTHRVTLTLWG